MPTPRPSPLIFVHNRISSSVKLQDDGIGFNPALAQRAGRRTGLGLTSMRERVNSVGGTLEFDSSPGRGTSLVIRVPINFSEVKHASSHPSR